MGLWLSCDLHMSKTRVFINVCLFTHLTSPSRPGSGGGAGGGLDDQTGRNLSIIIRLMHSCASGCLSDLYCLPAAPPRVAAGSTPDHQAPVRVCSFKLLAEFCVNKHQNIFLHLGVLQTDTQALARTAVENLPSLSHTYLSHLYY